MSTLVQHKTLSQNATGAEEGNHVQLSIPDFANESARLAYIQVPGDRGRQAWQLSDGTAWMAGGVTGLWAQVTGGGGGGGLADVSANTTTTTADATPTTIYTYETATNSRTLVLRWLVWGRVTGGTSGTVGHAAKFLVEAIADRDSGGTVTLKEDPTVVVMYRDLPGFDANLVVSGSDLLAQVTGAADTDFAWRSQIEVSEHG